MKYKLLLITALITFSYLGFSQIANPPSNIEICDDNNDELASFDLTLVEPEVIGGQDPGEISISTLSGSEIWIETHFCFLLCSFRRKSARALLLDQFWCVEQCGS